MTVWFTRVENLSGLYSELQKGIAIGSWPKTIIITIVETTAFIHMVIK